MAVVMAVMGMAIMVAAVSVTQDTVTVRSPCLSVILVLEFSDRGNSQIGSRSDISIRRSS